MPEAVARRQWLADLERELRSLVRGYDGSARKARELLEKLLVAEEEGLGTVSAHRHDLAMRMSRKRAA